MLCEKCNKNQANVHTVEIMNGIRHEHFLCTDCAQGVQFAIPIMMQIISGVPRKPQREEAPACECGATYQDFSQLGLLGCEKCYKTFESLITPVIKRAQGGSLRHTGRRPQSAMILDECERLKEELRVAVAEERYERAAQIRDLIIELEKKA